MSRAAHGSRYVVLIAAVMALVPLWWGSRARHARAGQSRAEIVARVAAPNPGGEPALQEVRGVDGRFLAGERPLGAEGGLPPSLRIPVRPPAETPERAGDGATRAAAARGSERPAVKGRIVERETGRSVPRAAGNFVMECRSGSTRSGLICGDDGRFTIALGCPPVRSLDITLSSPDVGRMVRHIDDVPDDGLDLGDLELEPASDVHFRVSDLTGAAIQGAIARVRGPAFLQSEPTGADGRGVLPSVAATVRTLAFEALGFETVEISIGDEGFSESLPLVVELACRPALRLALQAADGTPLPSAFVLLRCSEERPFASDRGPTVDPIQIELGAPRPRRRTIATQHSSANEPKVSLAYIPDRSGKLFVPGLRPAGRIGVEVEDKVGNVLIRRELSPGTLARGEELVLRLQRSPTVLALTVVDARGSPVSGAEVTRADGREALGHTDASGVLRIEPLYGSEIGVLVARSGFAPQRVVQRSLEAPLARRRIVLGPGRTMRVRVIDVHGRDADIDGISVRFEHLAVGVQALLEDGSTREFRDLPAEPFDWVVAAGGHRIKERCDTGARDVVITLPAFGSLTVELSPRVRWNDASELRVRAEPGGSPAIVRPLPPAPPGPTGPTDGGLRFPVLFPGRYTVDLIERDGRTAADDSTLAQAVVEVRAGESARLVLMPH